MKLLFKKGTVLLAGSLLCVASLWASENDSKPKTLILHHFLSSKAPPHSKLLEPWARKLEKISNGKIKVEIYPSMSMGGKPNELYKQAKDGVADIVYTVAGYTPGVFPRIEVLELPTIHTNSSLKTALAAKENFDLLKDDFKNVKPLLIAMTGSYQLHTAEKKISKASDLKGLKLRSPSRTGAWYIEELGAEPVGMPLPAVPQSLSKNAIDGAVLPMEVFPAFKFQQLTKYTTEIQGGGGFGGSVLLLLMNQDRYDSLSKELQEAIDKSTVTSIEDWAKLADDMEVFGKNLQIKSGGEVNTLSVEETKKLDVAGEKVIQRWVAEMKSKGIDGQKIVDSVKKSLDK
ncbi:MAG: C4-dicarboxylate ABC transporter substrate-binding protein [Arcobacter sp.]|nr:MAG: C4-dicarboxylate ABC transporter substrate-binding protein [Arcobacter sp.]